MDGLEIKTFPLGDLLTNAYLVINKQTKNCFLVDAPQGLAEVKRFLEEENYNLLYLVLTHGHADHIAGLEDIDCPFYIHPQDKEFLKDPFLNLSCLFSSFTIDKEPRLIEENNRLFLDSYILEVLHTPGHTPGSISLKLDSFLFAGDTLFSGSVGRTDFPYGSGELLLASIKEKIFPLGENTLIFPGHGEATNLKREIDNNPFF
ncbi:MAG: MBL fold metallo-hydrolase [Candidatus Omnitrophica bacterium]|nr:MBL fold metallo-hydrolase [Candidatus Omnitrophota bacterium]